MTVKALSIAIQEQEQGEVTQIVHDEIVAQLACCPHCDFVLSDAKMAELVGDATDLADFDRRHTEAMHQHDCANL
jgi:hypothetical protein